MEREWGDLLLGHPIFLQVFRIAEKASCHTFYKDRFYRVGYGYAVLNSIDNPTLGSGTDNETASTGGLVSHQNYGFGLESLQKPPSPLSIRLHAA